MAAACVAKNFDENPLEKQKVLKRKNIAAIRAECGRGSEAIQFPGLRSSLPDGAGEGPLDFEVSIHNQAGFACMAPNFLGTDDRDKSDCVMWKGGRVHYYVERSIGSTRGRVMIEFD